MQAYEPHRAHSSELPLPAQAARREPASQPFPSPVTGERQFLFQLLEVKKSQPGLLEKFTGHKKLNIKDLINVAFTG